MPEQAFLPLHDAGEPALYQTWVHASGRVMKIGAIHNGIVTLYPGDRKNIPVKLTWSLSEFLQHFTRAEIER